MNDIPAFTEGGGVSTLILREIPYKKTAFIMVRTFDSVSLDEHLREAASLCRFAGAKAVFASAEEKELFPAREPDYKMLRLSAEALAAEESSLKYEALDEGNLEQYLGIYNACFSDMLSAETLTEKKIRKNLESKSRECMLYYIKGMPAAISDVEPIDDAVILNAVGVLPEFRGGCGSEVLRNVMARVSKNGRNKLCLDVMSTNMAALKMYYKHGFNLEKVLSCWYRIL